MLDQLVSSTANFVQNNVKLISQSYPVTIVTDKVKNMMGYKTNEEDNEDNKKKNIDTFNDAPPAPSYISIMDMIIGIFKGQHYSWYNWLFFVIGIYLTLIIISATQNYMIMLPYQIRLFTGFYLFFIGLTSDFTQLNLIYFTALGYVGLALYRFYLHTIDPTINIIPFNWDSFFPLRTYKNDGFMDRLNSLWNYLPMGTVGINYNNLVRATDEYITQQKALIPDYENLKGKLEPLYETFENHMIDINLPGFSPTPSTDNINSTIESAQNTVKHAKSVSNITRASRTISNANKVNNMISANRDNNNNATKLLQETNNG